MLLRILSELKLVYTVLFVSLISLNLLYAQDRFDVIATSVLGDLNSDSISDLVLVKMDTSTSNKVYKLEVFLKDSSGNLKQIVESTNPIIYPILGWNNIVADRMSTVSIENGVLWLNVELIRGFYKHGFKLKNNQFELINYVYTNSDGLSKITSIDFNLLTGVRNIEVVDYTNDKTISKQTDTIRIKPLPTLKEFKPLQNEWY
ncbi:MAG: hypothetical protein WDZ35_15610 [Crocinitomicaceae bacterium]